MQSHVEIAALQFHALQPPQQERSSSGCEGCGALRQARPGSRAPGSWRTWRAQDGAGLQELLLSDEEAAQVCNVGHPSQLQALSVLKRHGANGRPPSELKAVSAQAAWSHKAAARRVVRVLRQQESHRQLLGLHVHLELCAAHSRQDRLCLSPLLLLIPCELLTLKVLLVV